MKKLIYFLAMIVASFSLTLMLPTEVKAADKDTVVALGEDLTAEQKSIVLGLMNLSEADLKDCTVITISNKDEHAYLDAYLDKSVIGTKALTSVKMTKKTTGAGINVTTQNVNYCTTGMYRNALLTAGVEDRDVLVVAPTPVSGTAGLIGAIQAYEASGSGNKISDKAVDTALNEMITTGEISAQLGSVSSEDVEAFIAWLKNLVASGELDTSDEGSIKDAIGLGEREFGVKLTSDEEVQIIDLLKKMDSLGLNGSYLISQAEKLYEKYGMDAINHTSDVIGEAIENAAKEASKSFFDSMKESVSDFFSGFFKK